MKIPNAFYMLSAARSGLLAATMLLLLGIPRPLLAQEPGVVEKIRVQGAQRIEADTVKSYLKIDRGQPFDPEAIRQSLRALYDTGFFKDVALDRDRNDLVVRVEENPMIAEIKFEGIDAFSQEELEKMVRVKARSIYNRAKTEKDLAGLRQAYRVKGLFLAKIDLLIKPLDNNQINLVYRITEGEKSKVRDVRVIGNHKISQRDLMKKLLIQPSGFFSWFTEDDTYDREKLLSDQAQLRDYYLNQGYARVQVNSSVAEMTPDRRAFVVTHSIQEGERFKFGRTEIKGDFDELPIQDLYAELGFKSGDWYSREELRNSLDKLNDKVGDFGYAMLDIQPDLSIHDDTKTVDILLNIQKGRRVYLNRIDISGNTRTRDEVIRREMRVVEGERFSASRIRKSKSRLDALNFFEKVEITTPQAADGEDRVDVQIKVEEKATGAFTIGAGYSTVDQVMGSASITQNNFLGKGQRVSLSFDLSAHSSNFNLGFTEPYFMDRNMSAGFDIFNRKTNYLSTSAYKQNNLGGDLRLGFPLNDRLSDTVTYSLTHVEIYDVADAASNIIKEQAQRSPYLQSMVSNSLLWSNLNDRFLPTEGRSHRLGTDLSGLGGDVRFARAMTDHSFYHTLIGKGDLVGHLRGRTGIVEGLGDDVPIFERFFLGGSRSIRGFKPGGLGPRSNDGEALGGTYFGQLNSELIFPFLGLGDKGVRGITFVDTGLIGDIEKLGGGVNTVESSSPRVSAGFGLHWVSPFGPLRFEFGFPLKKEEFDRTRTFDFSIGTAL
ncbi:MAG: outer membrane protein assembly factor BamA [Magnetococcales bacterium]|nr:outer membrane protein assembly factor BamA [Magnetococcales bacterium]MBF0322015.1 outer membrane protein assembly factor BamA [Magnetococcales bacterium]